MGLLDQYNPNPDSGFNEALLAAAQALLTPRSRGGGMGAAFGAFPQAMQRAQNQQMQKRLFGLKERALDAEMSEAERKNSEAQAAKAQMERIIGTLPPEQQNVARMLGTKYFEGMAPKDQVLSPGAQLVRGGNVVAQAPFKPETPPEIVRLMKQRDELPPGHPWRDMLDKAINKSVTHAPAATAISYGSPVPVQLGDGSIGYAQPGNREGAPPQLMRMPGTNEPLTKPPTPPTGEQANAGIYLNRMVESDGTLRELETTISREGLAAKQSLEGVPLVGGALSTGANYALSPAQQKVEQAQRDFINAVLRKESGAVISPQEFENAKKQYFPQPGDSNAVIEQKRKNRQVAISGFRTAAGPVVGKQAPLRLDVNGASPPEDDPLGIRGKR